jgi:titin
MIFATVSSSTLSAEVTGLIPGTLYSFGIKAMNATGDSQLSNVRTAMPYTVADAPVLLAADEGSSQVALTWSAPSDTGFTPLTGYKILYGTVPEPSTPFATFGSDILAANATGLIPGTRYYFAVKAMNEAGDSSPSNIMSATPFTASEAPTLSSASAGSSKVTLTWTAPSMDGGRPVTAYRVYYGTTPAAGALFTTVDVATSSVDIMGLTPGTLYYFGIKAVNLAGDSPFSNIATATPYTSPGAPTLESAAEGPSQIMLIWSAPSYDGSTPIIGYKVFYGTTSPTVQFGDALPASVLSVNVTALTPGTTYHFAVKAINAAGDSHASNLRSAIPYTMPGAPTLESAASGPSQVTLMWTAPADLGLRPLLGYEIFYGTTAPDTQYQGLLPPEYGTINIMGLIPGTNYLFAVRALNIAGPGQSSNALAATPYTWPDPPELLIAESGVLQVALTWNAPRHTGFNDIIGYKVFFGTSSPDEQFGEELSLLAHGVNVTGLLAGTSYRFGVKAVNEAGDSNLSNILEATAFNVPDAPTGLTAVSNNAQVVLNWTAPSFNGGSVIDHYLVYQGSVALSNHYSSWNATISDLINGQTYVFTVAAHNLAGYGDQSTFVMTVPMTVPSEPMSVAATPGIDRITISWSSPASVGGSGLLGYHVYRTGAGEQALLASFSESVHGYVDGNVTSGNTYTYTVVAFNAVGNGPASTQVSATLQADGPTDNTLLYAGMAIVIIAALAIAVAVMRRKK